MHHPKMKDGDQAKIQQSEDEKRASLDEEHHEHGTLSDRLGGR